MARGPAPGWKARKQPVTDDYLLASVNQAGGPGKHHPETGHYSELIIRGFATREEALEYKRSLHRCAVFMHRNGILSVSVHTKLERDRKNGGWLVRFKAIDKVFSRKYVLDHYGPDRSQWPYDVHRRGGAS
jgi:hypothetical protein